MGKRERVRGHRFERELARLLTNHTGEDYKRNLSETRDGTSGDVIPASWTREGKPLDLVFVVEAKRRNKVSLDKAYSEAVEGLTPHPCQQIPVAIKKADRQPAMAYLKLSDLMSIVDRLRDDDEAK